MRRRRVRLGPRDDVKYSHLGKHVVVLRHLLGRRPVLALGSRSWRRYRDNHTLTIST